MKLTEALRINNTTKNEPNSLTVFLACGFTTLSLSSFLAAHLVNRIPRCQVHVATGSFGDLAGNIRRIQQSEADLAAVCVEWDDLDPRIGVRRLARVTWKDFPEILAQVRTSKEHLVSLILEASTKCRIAVSLPHLPIPPLPYSPAHAVDKFEAELRLTIAEMQVQLAEKSGIRVIKHRSPAQFDLSTTFYSGFPYTTEYADELGDLLAASLVAVQPKKGIIVDLDDTLWKGILGDEGVNGVHWDLDHHAQHHGLLQQFLHVVAAEGTLVAIASKNSPAIVHEAFAKRSDLLLREEDVFPIDAHWGPKSESVTRILRAWNVSADAVVFVDNSPLELAEVEMAHPGISCRLFPAQDLARFDPFLRDLRAIFAKEKVGDEDLLRAESLQTSASTFLDSGRKVDPETLLKSLEAELTFHLGPNASDERALELINKTNQFNLNGTRIVQPLWHKLLSRPGAFLLTCTYTDKFGTLGKIATIAGLVEPERMVIEFWVMSCRAFARRIEFACLQQLFQCFPVDRIVLQYRRTERNGPVGELLEFLGLSNRQESEIVLSKRQFFELLPALYHKTTLNVTQPPVETYA